jgi:flagellar biosynthetic protein FliO
VSDVSVVSLLFRVVVSLGVVIGLLWLAARVLGQGKLTSGLRSRTTPIEVLARHSVGRRASVTLVRTAGRGLVLGVTDSTVTVLADMPADDLVVEPPEAPRTASPVGASAPAPSAWKAILDAVRDKTARRS